MTIRIATMADLTRILLLRERAFSESHDGAPQADADAALDADRVLIQTQLNSPLHRTWIAAIDQDVVSMGTLKFFFRPFQLDGVGGFEAYLLNVYTLLQYRRRGFASAIVAAARDYAQDQGIQRLWLHATSAGQSLYQAAGFQNATTHDELKSA